MPDSDDIVIEKGEWLLIQDPDFYCNGIFKGGIHTTFKNSITVDYSRNQGLVLAAIHPFLLLCHQNLTFETHACTHTQIYRVSQEEWTKLRESVPYVELYQYNRKHLYPKLNGYGDNGLRKVWTSCISAYCTSTAVSH